jgi:hypothetical protein
MRGIRSHDAAAQVELPGSRLAEALDEVLAVGCEVEQRNVLRAQMPAMMVWRLAR